MVVMVMVTRGRGKGIQISVVQGSHVKFLRTEINRANFYGRSSRPNRHRRLAIVWRHLHRDDERC